MKEKKPYSKKQHYVQKALIESWSCDQLVNLALKKEDGSLVEEKPKAPRAVFYENYYYEHVYGFDSAEQHRKNGFRTFTDEKHIFQTNDGEQYCKTIEDQGFPVIQRIISAVLNNRSEVVLTQQEKANLCRYLVLQSLRTPGGRKNYQFDYEKYLISTGSNVEDALNSFVSNFAYLLMIGVYDDKGFANNIELPKSIFRYLFEIIVDMALYVLTLPSSNTEQFILGDNPSIVLGKKENIWGLLMPISPKVLILLLSDSIHVRGKCDIRPCPNQWRLFELSSQVLSAEKKIVFCSKYDGLHKIIYDSKASISSKTDLQSIWTAKELLSEVEKE